MAVLALDLMGTVLFDPYREALEAALAPDGGWTPRALQGRDVDAWPAFERGEIDEATFAARFWSDPQRAFDVATFNRVRRSLTTFLPGMQALVHAAARCLPLWIASNYPRWIDEHVVRFGLDALVAGVVASCDLGVRKPDPAFYAGLVERIGLAAQECLFVDDRADNCAGAVAAGLPSHHFTDAARLRGWLRDEHGITVTTERTQQ